MSSTELATVGPSTGALALHSDQHQFNEEQSAALAQLGLAGAPAGDLAVFLHVAQRTGLDPFSRQIYMIGRPDKQRDGSYKTKYTIQTGIDGFRIIADRHADYAGQTAPQWCGDDGQWRDFWPGTEAPVAARVGVHRRGWDEPVWGVAMYAEYAQRKSNGDLTAMWTTKGALMVAKCAEALALRKAFPHDLAGLMTTEEVERTEPARRERLVVEHDSPPVTVAELTGGTPVPDSADRMTPEQQRKLFALLRAAEIEDRWAWASGLLGREVSSYGQLTAADAAVLIDRLNSGLATLANEPAAAEGTS